MIDPTPTVTRPTPTGRWWTWDRVLGLLLVAIGIVLLML